MNRTARLAPALVLSVAVIGSASAGSAVAAKMITGKDIKNGSVASVDVKNGSLGSVDVKNGALTGTDVKNGAIAEGKLAGAVKQKLNAPAVRGYEVVTSTESVDAGSASTVFVACTGDKVAVGGGGEFTSTDQALTVQGSTPREYFEESALYAPATATSADAWAVSVFNGLANLEDVTAYVICVDPS